jgi:hypothetical protein
MQRFKDWLVLEMPMETGRPGLGLVTYAQPTPTLFVLVQNSPSLRQSFRDSDYDAAKESIVGVLTMRDNEIYQTWEVDRVWAQHGFGPLLYYVAMTYAGGVGLMPNRISGYVSPEAKNVWSQFLNGAGSDKVVATPIVPNNSAHHPEPHLMHKYVLKKKMNLSTLLRAGQRIIGHDPYGERLNFIIETAEAVLQGHIEDLYPPY